VALLKADPSRLPDVAAADVTHFVRQADRPEAGRLDEAQPLADGVGARYQLDGVEGDGYREFIRASDDLFVVMVDTTANIDWTLKFVEEDFLTFQFRLEGASTEMAAEQEEPMEPDATFFGVDLHPAGMEKIVWIPSGTRFRQVSLKLKPSFVQRLLGGPPDWMPEPPRAYLDGGAAEFFSLRLPLSGAMRQSCADLLDCGFQGALRRAYAEAKAGELLCLALDAMARRDETRVLPVRLYERDIVRLREAQEILLENYAAPPPVTRLARRVGLNRNKLAYGFKHIFGVTISQFLQMKRMEEAYALLKEGRMGVAQAAETVGYADPGGFAKLFRRHFGVLPKDVLQDGVNKRPESTGRDARPSQSEP